MAERTKSFRYAVRRLQRDPGFTLAAVLTLALGIGATTAIFSVVKGILLDPLPYEEGNRLVQVWTEFPEEGIDRLPVSPAEYLDYREETEAFESLTAYTLGSGILTGGEYAERLRVAVTTADLWPMLREEASLGRVFTPEEDRPGKASVIVLGHGFWSRRFGAEPEILGRKINLSGDPYTVIGVAPEGFSFPEPGVEAWVPLALDRASIEGRSGHFLKAVGRLREGVTVERARQEMDLVVSQWRREYEHAHPMTGASLREEMVGDLERPLWILLGSVVFVLLIACTNVVSLMLARNEAQRMDLSVRSALGASRRRLLWQQMAEASMLASVGALSGIGLAFLVVRGIHGMVPPDFPRIQNVEVDPGVLLFSLFVTVLAILVSGLIPALQASKPDATSLVNAGRGNLGGIASRRWLRGALVVGEIALAVTLLIGASLLVRSFSKLHQVDPGFRAEGLLTARMFISEERYQEPHQVAGFFGELRRRLEEMPAVEAVSHVDHLPMWHDLIVERFEVVGRPPASDDEAPVTKIQVVPPGFFEVFGTPLRSGRGFRLGDDLDAPRVAVANQSFVETFLRGSDPLSPEVLVHAAEPEEPAFRIVGVVGNVRDEGLRAEPQPTLYVPHAQAAAALGGLAERATLLVRTSGDPEALVRSVRLAVDDLDDQIALYYVEPMEGVVSRSLGEPRMLASIFACFALLGAILAVVGIYALLAQLVRQRFREFGLRFTAGADRGDIVGLVLGWGGKLILVGLAIGLVAGLAGSRVLGSVLFGVGPLDWASFLIAGVLFSATAFLACYLPARRAARIDPMVSMRVE